MGAVLKRKGSASGPGVFHSSSLQDMFHDCNTVAQEEAQQIL